MLAQCARLIHVLLEIFSFALNYPMEPSLQGCTHTHSCQMWHGVRPASCLICQSQCLFSVCTDSAEWWGIVCPFVESDLRTDNHQPQPCLGKPDCERQSHELKLKRQDHNPCSCSEVEGFISTRKRNPPRNPPRNPSSSNVKSVAMWLTR